MTMESYDDVDDTGKIQGEERVGRESWCLRGLCPPRIRQAERYDDHYDDDDDVRQEYCKLKDMMMEDMVCAV